MLPLLLVIVSAPLDAARYLPNVDQSGDAVATIRLCGELLKEPDAARVIDAVLQQRELSRFDEIVLESRLAVARQGLVDRVSQPDYRELPILLGPLVAHLRREYKAVREHPLLNGDTPPKPPDYADFFWDQYTLENQIAQLEHEAKYYAQIVQRFPRSQAIRLDESSARYLDETFASELGAAISNAAKVRQEREMYTRLVGFLEYGKALRDFERLARTASPEELEIMDELVRSDPQYTVHVNLVRRMPQSQLSAFAPAPENDACGGLPWIIALARLEYGAILAGFTKETVPFPIPPPDTIDGQAFDALLLESALMHGWALQNMTRSPARARRSGLRLPEPDRPRNSPSIWFWPTNGACRSPGKHSKRSKAGWAPGCQRTSERNFSS